MNTPGIRRRWFLAAVLLAMMGCGHDDDDDGVASVPDTTSGFNSALDTMSAPVTFNAGSAGIQREEISTSPPQTSGWLRPRNTDDRVHVDPRANRFGIDTNDPFEPVFSFEPVFFASGTEVFSEHHLSMDDEFSSTSVRALLLLPGSQASGLEWSSHVTWDQDQWVLSCFIFSCVVEQFLTSKVMFFGVRTSPQSIPDSEIFTYVGYASGYQVSGSDRVRFRGDLTGTVDFDTGKMQARLYNLVPEPFSDTLQFGRIDVSSIVSDRDFSGSALADTDCQDHGTSMLGSLYGPKAREIAGVLLGDLCGGRFMAAFAGRRP